MDLPIPPKMSLVAQYDDLCRYTKVLTSGCEEEFKEFAQSQLHCVREWKGSQNEFKKKEDIISQLREEKSCLETKNKHLKSLLSKEIEKRKLVEMEKSSMERQIGLIKEVLLSDNVIDNQTKQKLFLLSSCQQPALHTIDESGGSAFLLSDIDITDDDLDNDSAVSSRRTRRSKGKRSSSDAIISSKRRKSEDNNQSFHEELITDHPKFTNEVTKYRSSSEPATNSPERVFVKQVHRSDSEQVKSSTYSAERDYPGSIFGSKPFGRYYTSIKLTRTHVFCNKTIIRAEKCYPCGRIIKFCKQSLKCQDCRITCHPECKDQCPKPCIPVTRTPTKGEMGTIADYTSNTPPMIPSLIVHCVNEIEGRGLKELGLYRVSGSEREVKDLKEKFLRGRNTPCINQVDIHAICGTVKEFLRSLKEPLIPRSSWQIFVNAADTTNITQSLNNLRSAVHDLPQPNRDTLAFLVLHLQRVAASPECRMPTENLGKIFGPTVVGYSSAEPADCNIVCETKYQCKVMQRLLLISEDFWKNSLHFEPDVFDVGKKTPDCLSTPPVSRLGPLYGSVSKSKTAPQLGKIPLTPRNTRFGIHKEKKKFFASPLLKN